MDTISWWWKIIGLEVTNIWVAPSISTHASKMACTLDFGWSILFNYSVCFVEFSHWGNKKIQITCELYNVSFVQFTPDFLNLFLQKLPYFEERQSEFATFRRWVDGLHQNKVGIWKILLSCLSSSQIWLIPLVDECQSTYLTKLKKTNPGQVVWNSISRLELIAKLGMLSRFDQDSNQKI
jgi:hypothetical protein